MSRRPLPIAPHTKVRDVLAELRARGCRPVRTQGSHQTWETSSGVRFQVVVNHLNDSVGFAVAASVRKAVGG